MQAGRPRRHRRQKKATPMTTSPSPRPPLPPFDRDAAIQKVRLAEDAWNTRDPQESRPATPRTACGAIARSFSARDQGLPAVYARRAPLDAGGYGGVFQPRAGRAADAAGEGGARGLHAPVVTHRSRIDAAPASESWLGLEAIEARDQVRGASHR